MAKITYPTQQLIDGYLGYSSKSPNIGNNLGYTRNEPGFSVVGISNIPVIQNLRFAEWFTASRFVLQK